MSRIAQRFEQLKAQGRTALIPYFTAGDPDPGLTVELMHTLVKAGADLIELGVPFSDPMAEGPVIQAACERALIHDVSLRDVLALVQVFRETDNDTPVILMGYVNPVEVMGYDTFAEEASRAGVDGVLIVDMPPEEGEAPIQSFKAQNLDLIFLAAPTSHAQRLEKIAAASSGFVYYVSLKGVTGAASLDTRAVAEQLVEVRQYVDLPIGVGFGIKDAESAAKV
ncbi:MAG TPA: tryptophan synthase subunit alpha, partial [Gammaproteobacteria bacterium]|nr:tryptophan synthase subunit alpha [Gammaproteobacteria bacterium]